MRECVLRESKTRQGLGLYNHFICSVCSSRTNGTMHIKLRVATQNIVILPNPIFPPLAPVPIQSKFFRNILQDLFLVNCTATAMWEMFIWWQVFQDTGCTQKALLSSVLKIYVLVGKMHKQCWVVTVLQHVLLPVLRRSYSLYFYFFLQGSLKLILNLGVALPHQKSNPAIPSKVLHRMCHERPKALHTLQD